MRRDDALVEDILTAAVKISTIIRTTSREAIETDDLRQAAVLFHLSVIGEAANKLSPDFRSANPSIPWAQIVGQRNQIIHEYFGIDWDLVWKTITEDLPVLAERLGNVG